MAPMNDKDRVNFLLCALRHSGKTDWAGVGKELDLKTDTASKRLVYITAAAEKTKAQDGGPDGVATPKKKATPRKKASPVKKLKLEGGKGKNVGLDDDDEELDGELTPKPNRKRGRTISKVAAYNEESDDNGAGTNGKNEAAEDGEGLYNFDTFKGIDEI